MKNLSWIKGLVFGVLFSFISAFVFTLLASAAIGGITSFTPATIFRILVFMLTYGKDAFFGEGWLYFSVIIPFAITFAILGGYFHNRNKLSSKKLWLISLLSAFLVTWYSGTIGAIFGETIVRGGIDTINVEGTLVWGTIYAFVLLPLTTPFARLLIGIFYKFVKIKSLQL